MDYGELLLETGKLNEADSLFSDLSERYPDNAGFLYRLGLVKEKQKDSTALKYFFMTLSKDFTHQAAIYKAAKYYLKNRKSYNAISLCETGLKTRPNNPSLLSILGQAYMRTLQFEKAIPPFEKLLEFDEDSEFIFGQLAKAYRTTGQTEKAIETYKQMLEINDANAAVHSNLGVLYLKQNKAEKAKIHFTMALLIKKQPVDSEYVNIGISFKRLEQYQEAYQNFQKAPEENPDNERALIEMALVADASKEDKEVILKLYQNYMDKYREKGR